MSGTQQSMRTSSLQFATQVNLIPRRYPRQTITSTPLERAPERSFHDHCPAVPTIMERIAIFDSRVSMFEAGFGVELKKVFNSKLETRKSTPYWLLQTVCNAA